MTHQIIACTSSDFDRIVDIINLAAEAYRGVIPDESFHDPYMAEQELRNEIAAGVEFSGYIKGEQMIGVMGIQNVADVTLIRHAYVHPDAQRLDVGARLLHYLRQQSDKPILIGTWKAATWATDFYQKHGFEFANVDSIWPLLKRYWTVPESQIQNSCVLIESQYRSRFDNHQG